ncbi:hypothetical protein Ccrd_026169, partial [Cynara cardunculus var. scolymus]
QNILSDEVRYVHFDFHHICVWATQGDDISIQYSGTPTLKGDFVRFGSRCLNMILNGHSTCRDNLGCVNLIDIAQNTRKHNGSIRDVKNRHGKGISEGNRRLKAQE